jgi:cytochrome P450
MSDREVHDHIMSMIVAGHETTSAELAWSFQLLAHNPAVQDHLVSELGNDPESPYLTATIHETMRHRPAFLFAIPRKVITPTELGGWHYPAGTHLVPCTYLMHHDPDLYPEPNTFRPERFVDTHPQPGSYLPWGAGHKRCIGRHFALLEMQSVLRETLNRHTIQPATASIESPRWRSAILVPQHGSRIILHPRTS